MTSENKILSRHGLLLRYARPRDRTVVFTNGCFDLLHAGHVEYLEEARALGDVLIVGVNSDGSVRRLKGSARPLVDLESRCRVLAGLECVDAVTGFDEDTPLELLQKLLPDVLVKGGDYAEEEVVGRTPVLAAGGRVEIIPFREGHSTTSIIERIRNQTEEPT